MKVSEKAYTAGLLDGEGTIASFTNASGGAFLSISIAQRRDERGLRLMNWLLVTWGGSINEQANHKKGVYVWRLNSGKEQMKFLLKLLPFLIIKKAQARLAISLIITKNKLGRILGSGYQNAQPPDDIVIYRLRVVEAIKALNSGNLLPAETECERLIQLGKELIQKYHPKDEYATVQP